MTDQDYSFNLNRIVSDDNNQEKKSWACLGQTCSRSLIVFLSELFAIMLKVFGCFWTPHLSKTCDESSLQVCVVQLDTFHPHQDYEHNNFYGKSRPNIIGRFL